MVTDDIEITHGGGKTTIRGLEREKIKELRDRVKASGDRAGSVNFRGVDKIDVLQPGTNDPQQTIYGTGEQG